jgi:hypothetical protein
MKSENHILFFLKSKLKAKSVDLSSFNSIPTIFFIKSTTVTFVIFDMIDHTLSYKLI